MIERDEHSISNAAQAAFSGRKNDVDALIAISGATPAGRSKATVHLKYYELFSDGTTKEIHSLKTAKPIINIFKNAGFVNVFLDFGNSFDSDLYTMFDVVTEYLTTGKVSYLPEEVAAGFYQTPDGSKMVHFPVLSVEIRPADAAETQVFHGYKPRFCTVAPSSVSGDPCVLQLTFREEAFSIAKELMPVTIPDLYYLDLHESEIAQLSNDRHPVILDRISDISGTTPTGRPKAHVVLEYYEQYSDGTTKEIHTMSVQKPLITIYRHAGYVNVYLDFGRRHDADLRVMYDVLNDYRKPSNSVSYTPDELESGFHETPDGPKMVHFPVLNLALSPVGKEDSYMLYFYNPVYFTLAPNQIHGDASVIQFTFMEETFAIANDLKRIDPNEIHNEVMVELEAERRGLGLNRLG